MTFEQQREKAFSKTKSEIKEAYANEEYALDAGDKRLP